MGLRASRSMLLRGAPESGPLARRRALREEGVHAGELLGVLEEVALDLVVQATQVRLGGAVEPGEERLLRAAHGLGRLEEDRGEERERGREDLIVLDDAVHETDAQRLV